MSWDLASELFQIWNRTFQQVLAQQASVKLALALDDQIIYKYIIYTVSWIHKRWLECRLLWHTDSHSAVHPCDKAFPFISLRLAVEHSCHLSAFFFFFLFSTGPWTTQKSLDPQRAFLTTLQTRSVLMCLFFDDAVRFSDLFRFRRGQ